MVPAPEAEARTRRRSAAKPRSRTEMRMEPRPSPAAPTVRQVRPTRAWTATRAARFGPATRAEMTMRPFARATRRRASRGAAGAGAGVEDGSRPSGVDALP
ncbi:MAG: hypothetical protein U0237_20890 [Thermoleophilia bacterium]